MSAVLTKKESEILASPCDDKDFSYLVNFFYKEVAPHLGQGLNYCQQCQDALGEEFLKNEMHSIPTGKCDLCEEDLTLKITQRALSCIHNDF